MYFSKKIRVTALFLALMTCFCILPGAAFADTCEHHSYIDGALVPATATEDGSIEHVCSVCGESYTETIPHIASVSFHAAVVAYKAKAQRPDITVKDSEGNVISSEYYSVALETSEGASVPFCKPIGKYNVIITFEGRYSGTITRHFKIVPKSVKNVSVESDEEKTVTITYDKLDGAKGYIIYYSRHKNGPFKELGTTKSTSFTSRKLKSGKTYYFKVKAYKLTRGGKMIGMSSKVKRVKVQ